jgi:glucosylglycerate hydrolase
MQVKIFPRSALVGREALAERAQEVLRQNDMGGWTRAAPELYPHQWSWDTGFIAIGLAHLDTSRAAQELLTLFQHQWKTGKVPHIVFNPEAPPESYFPGPDHWACAAASPDAPPAPPYTSCLCQPPIHAIAALRIWEAASNGRVRAEATAFLRDIYPRLLAWHRYLMTYRDPEGSGLVTIYHPWESGTDNSPRWDAALEAVEVGEVSPHPRYDLEHVHDPSQRPTDADYDRYLWLVKLVKRAACDEATIYRSHPFLVKDVLFSAILVAANEALLEISRLVGASHEDAELISGWISRGRHGLESRWDPELRLCLDYDLRAAKPLRSRTVAGFAPLVAGDLRPRRLAILLETLRSPSFIGYPGLRRPLPPGTSPKDPGFNPRSYWRGPVWPVIDWLLWWAFMRAGERQLAERVRKASLAQIAEGGFAEYFEPFTGEPLGSDDQSWTAAVVLDWLAGGSSHEHRAAA